MTRDQIEEEHAKVVAVVAAARAALEASPEDAELRKRLQQGERVLATWERALAQSKGAGTWE